jgi:ABC-2 type transport system permease protein
MRCSVDSLLQLTKLNLKYVTFYAVLELRASYRRTTLGKYWLSVQNLISSLALFAVFSRVFEQTNDYLLYISLGLAFWSLLSSCLERSATLLVAGRNELLNSNISINVFILRHLLRCFVDFIFTLITPITIFLLLNFQNGFSIISDLFYFSLMAVNFVVGVFAFSYLIAFVGVFFRDIPQIIGNLTQLLFLITPVFWSVSNIENIKFLFWNPIFHFLSAPRCKLLDCSTQIDHDFFALTFTVTVLLLAIFCIKKYSNRIIGLI